MKETDGGEGASKHLPVMYPLISINYVVLRAGRSNMIRGCARLWRPTRARRRDLQRVMSRSRIILQFGSYFRNYEGRERERKNCGK